MPKILIGSLAKKQLLKLPVIERQRVMIKISALESDPKPPGCKKIVGTENNWRIRVGDYRVVYEPDEIGDTVKVCLVKHSREAYR